MNSTSAEPTSVGLLIVHDPIFESVKRSLTDGFTYQRATDLSSLIALSPPAQTQLLVVEAMVLSHDIAEAIQNIKHAYPETHMLIVGPQASVEEQVSFLKYGVRGYFDQALVPNKLPVALELILHGEVWVERHVIAGLIDELTQPPKLSEEQQAALDSLTPKELEVAKAVSHGATNKMIARAMDITERTVKAHLTTIFQKMDLPDRLSLAIFFRDIR